MCPCHSYSQGTDICDGEHPEHKVKGRLLLQGHPVVLELRVISQPANIHNFNNCMSVLGGESICLEGKRRELFYVF